MASWPRGSRRSSPTRRGAACWRVPIGAPNPPVGDAARWGAYWAAGSTLAGALWGVAAVAMFPALPAYQALFIVCQFGVILGGLNLTAVYKPSFYGFVLPVLVPLIARVAVEGDQVHLFTAGVLGVVLAFVLAFGRAGQRRADPLARDALRKRRPHPRAHGADGGGARRARRRRDREPRQEPVSRRREPRPAPAAARDGPLRRGARRQGARPGRDAAGREHPRVGRSARASLRATARPVAARCRSAAAGAGRRRPATALRAACAPTSRRRRWRRDSCCASFPRAWPSRPIRCCSSASCATSSPTRCATRPTGGIVLGARRRAEAVRIDVIDSGVGIARRRFRARLRRVRATRRGAAQPCRRSRPGTGPRDRAPAREPLRTPDRARLDTGTRLALLDHRAACEYARAAPAIRRARDGSPLPRSSRTLAGRRIVVVDDDPAVVAAMRRALRVVACDGRRRRRTRGRRWPPSAEAQSAASI